MVTHSDGGKCGRPAGFGTVPADMLSLRLQSPRSSGGKPTRSARPLAARAPEAARQDLSDGQADDHIRRRRGRRPGVELAANREGVSAYREILMAAIRHRVSSVHESRSQRSSSTSKRGDMGSIPPRTLPIPPRPLRLGPLEARTPRRRAGPAGGHKTKAQLSGACQSRTPRQARPRPRKASGYTDRPNGTKPVRYASVNTAT